MKPALIRMTWIILTFVVLGCLLLYFGQDKLIFIPRDYEPEHRGLFEQYDVLEFSTPDGKQKAFYQGPKGELPVKLWVISGGNGARALGWDYLVRPTRHASLKTGFLLIEYPGYGDNEGRPSRAGIARNSDEALKLLADELGVSLETLQAKVSCLGHSLGAAVALENAARWERGEVIALAPFTSIKGMARNMVGGPLSNLVRHRFDNVQSLEGISKLSSPQVTIFHGDQDNVIPISMATSMAEQFPSVVTYHELKGVGHNDIGWELRERLVGMMTR